MKMLKRGFYVFLLLLGVCESAKIIMIMPMYTKSHNTMFEYEAKILADRGHKISLFTPYPMKKSHPNIEFYQVGDPTKLNENEDHKYLNGNRESPLEFFYNFIGFFVDSCEDFYKSPKVQSYLDQMTSNNSEKLFDMAIVELLPTECVLPFASIAANYTILTSVITVPFWNAVEMRIPAFTSTTPMVYLTEFGTPASFWERFVNTFNSFVAYGIWKYYIISGMQDITTRYLPPWAPSVLEALRNVNFIITNDDDVSGTPRPTVPFIAQVAGVHLREAEPLPKDLEDFIQSSGDEGFILFSFGSFLNTRDMSIQKRDTILAALGKLKQKVLFKYHEQVEGCPKNVKLSPWLPQNDLLAKPELRLFVTHGGILSSQELLYHGVPIVGIPLFADQQQNVAVLEQFGIGEVLLYHNITTENLYNIINRVLENESYAERAKEAAAIMRDKQNSAKESIIYWTEYIMRHNGAFHLKNRVAQDLYLFQFLLLDVLAVMLLLVAFVAILINFTVNIIIKMLLKKPKQKTS